MNRNKRKDGAVLVVVLLLAFPVLLFAVTLAAMKMTDARAAGSETVLKEAFYIAEAGIQKGLWAKHREPAWTGTLSDMAFAEGAFDVEVAEVAV